MLKEPIFSKEFVFHDCMQLYWEYKLSVDGDSGNCLLGGGDFS